MGVGDRAERGGGWRRGGGNPGRGEREGTGAKKSGSARARQARGCRAGPRRMLGSNVWAQMPPQGADYMIITLWDRLGRPPAFSCP